MDGVRSSATHHGASTTDAPSSGCACALPVLRLGQHAIALPSLEDPHVLWEATGADRRALAVGVGTSGTDATEGYLALRLHLERSIPDASSNMGHIDPRPF